jgi:hypothetical protein
MGRRVEFRFLCLCCGNGGLLTPNQSLQADRSRITVFRSSQVSRPPRLLSE